MAYTGSEEREHYQRMVGMIMQGDADKKKRLDIEVQQALASARATMPGAETATLIAFFASVAVILARILATPLQDVARVAESVFDGYTCSAATLLDAYDPDDPGVPDYAPEKQPAGDAAAQHQMDKLLSRAYLLC